MAMEHEDLATELSDQDRILLVFGYLGPLALVSLVATRREFVKWHAKQGILLSISIVGAYVVYRILGALFPWDWWRTLLWAGAMVTFMGVLVLILLCIVRALEGERFRVPMLGELADRI